MKNNTIKKLTGLRERKKDRQRPNNKNSETPN